MDTKVQTNTRWEGYASVIAEVDREINTLREDIEIFKQQGDKNRRGIQLIRDTTFNGVGIIPWHNDPAIEKELINRDITNLTVAARIADSEVKRLEAKLQDKVAEREARAAKLPATFEDDLLAKIGTTLLSIKKYLTSDLS